MGASPNAQMTYSVVCPGVSEVAGDCNVYQLRSLEDGREQIEHDFCFHHILHQNRVHTDSPQADMSKEPKQTSHA